MSQYDVAIGLNKTTLDTGIKQLYDDKDAREKLFKGTQSGELLGIKYTAGYDMKAAPTFTLAPPSQTTWGTSYMLINQGEKDEVVCQVQKIKMDQGNYSCENEKTSSSPPMPAANVFQIVFSQFYGEYTLGPAPAVSGTTEVVAIVEGTIQGNSLTMKLLSVWLDESKMGGWDQTILNQVVLKQVIIKANTLVAGLKIPDLSLSLPKGAGTIELTAPVVSIVDACLILAASLKSKGAVDISGVTWPTKDLFVLISQDVLQEVANDEITSMGLVGKEKSGSGSEKGLSYSYTAKIKSVDVSFSASDLTKIAAAVGFGFEATLKPLGMGGPCSMTAASGSL